MAFPWEKPTWWTSDHWSTTSATMGAAIAQFGAFDLDPCCRPETAKAPKFYTAETNGLIQPWFGKVWLNCPYSDPAPWLRKSISETSQGRARLVVALLPVRTDTKWFHSLVWGVAELQFLKGRVKWIGWQGTPIPNPKDPSMLAIYRAAS